MKCLKPSWIIVTKTQCLKNKKKQFSRQFLFPEVAFFCHEIDQACCCVYPVIPRTLHSFSRSETKKHYKKGPAVFHVYGASLVHIAPRPVTCFNRICASASLASPLPTTCSLSSAQTASSFSISCISDNQNITSIVFSKALFMPP